MPILNGDSPIELNGIPPKDGESGNDTLSKIIQKVVSAITSFGTASAKLVSVIATTVKADVLEASTIKVDSSGGDAIAGKATLVAGTVTVATTRVKTGSFIQLTGVGTTNAGHLCIGTITNATSFVIDSTSGTDARVVHWEIKEPIT